MLYVIEFIFESETGITKSSFGLLKGIDDELFESTYDSSSSQYILPGLKTIGLSIGFDLFIIKSIGGIRSLPFRCLIRY